MEKNFSAVFALFMVNICMLQLLPGHVGVAVHVRVILAGEGLVAVFHYAGEAAPGRGPGANGSTFLLNGDCSTL